MQSVLAKFTGSSVAILLLISSVSAEPVGLVQYALDMGGTTRQAYACVFSGVVTAHGKICPGAHIEADLAGANDQAMIERVDADETGHFALRLVVQGSPNDETMWKITAKAAAVAAEPVEVEGHLILSDETTVVINRSIQVEQAGA